MIQGRVTQRREAHVELSVKGNQGTVLTITAILDTGFSDYLTLHPDEITALELDYEGAIQIMLANGSTELVRICNASVDWDDAPLPINVQASLGGHLVGMRMLGGCTITMDVCVDSEVTIETETCAPFA